MIIEENKNPETMGSRASTRIWSGIVFVLAGILLLAYKMGAPIPGWVFTWPVLLIAIGLISGIKSRFHNPGAMIMILVGGIFLIDQTVSGINFHNYIIPIVLISIGLMFILRPKGSSCGRMRRQRGFQRFNQQNDTSSISSEIPSIPGASDTGKEFINVQAIFGGVKKNIQSKNFGGGEIISFMGGSEINFMQADIQSPVELEVNNIFGGTKLIIPSNWDVKNDISALFGGVEDKRNFNNSHADGSKQLRLKGSCVFGGIEVTNY